ncbi:MAG: asparagine synthase (glutamine-hydrolyzing) [Ghiorsea sp.]
MCGILGSVNIDISQSVVDLLHHRGPDGQGFETLDVRHSRVCLAHTRLAIMDLSPAGKQPMQSRDGRWWVTFNGEIYNHLELRKNLGICFRGHSDTETLLELIASQGIKKTLPLLNGMYAFAALDMHEGKLYLGRDPFGIKPLYYAERGKSFAFSSEIRALKAMGLASEGVDSLAMQQFMTLRYTPAPKTLLNGIKRLQPGHMLSVDIVTGASSLMHFSAAVKDRFEGSLDDAISSYKEELFKSVKRQLLSDVPVGVLLSGGIDSALIAAMAKDVGSDLPCYSVGFGNGHTECELDDAAETARVLGLPFTAVEVTPELLMDALPAIVSAIEEPLGTTSIMPMWYLVKKAREDVTVVLTGQGTDEPWGGYRRYQVEMVHRMFPFNGFWAAARKMSLMAGNLPEFMERGLRTLPVRDMAARAVEACSLFSKTERMLLLGNAGDGGSAASMNYWLDGMKSSDCSPSEKMMRMDARMNLADDLLLYGDKQSMSVSLEARVPMLDIELVKLVESFPLSYRMALGKTKIVHKKMAESYLPHSIVHRKKKGFGVPFSDWSRGVWRPFIEEVLLAKDAPHWQMLKREGVLKFWNQHLTGKPDRSRQIFSLFMLALWWRVQ